MDQSRRQEVSPTERKLQIMQQRISNLVSGYEDAMAELQLERELLVQQFQMEKTAWENERKVLLEKIEGQERDEAS